MLTTGPITARQLHDALPDTVDPQDAEVMVVAPALAQNALRFWVSDADEAIAERFGRPVDRAILSPGSAT